MELLPQQKNEVYNWHGSYVLRKMCMDRLHIQKYTHILHDGFWLYIRHFAHKSWWNMDLDIFLVCMQGGWGIPDQTCIPVLVLQKVRKNLMQMMLLQFMQYITSTLQG